MDCFDCTSSQRSWQGCSFELSRKHVLSLYCFITSDFFWSTLDCSLNILTRLFLWESPLCFSIASRCFGRSQGLIIPPALSVEYICVLLNIQSLAWDRDDRVCMDSVSVSTYWCASYHACLADTMHCLSFYYMKHSEVHGFQFVLLNPSTAHLSLFAICRSSCFTCFDLPSAAFCCLHDTWKALSVIFLVLC